MFNIEDTGTYYVDDDDEVFAVGVDIEDGAGDVEADYSSPPYQLVEEEEGRGLDGGEEEYTYFEESPNNRFEFV